MTKPRPRIAVCGLGSIGAAVSRLLIDYRSGFDLVGAATLESDLVGRSLGEVVGASGECATVISATLGDVLDLQPDVVVYATGSFLPGIDHDVREVIAAGANLVSPCEELAFPFTRDGKWSREIDRLAANAGVTVLGSGVNPGFIFDSFVLAATGSSWDISRIHGRRVVNVSGFGENIHKRLGIGYSQEEFEIGHSNGSIAGHVGFPESIQMIAERLGVTLDGPISEVFTSMIAESPAPTRYGAVAVGKSEGFIQRATGVVNGEAFLEFELILHLRPEASGMKPADTFSIEGVHPINITLSPGMDAIPATSAQLVNAIPGLLAAKPGLLTVKDLPAATAWFDLQKAMLR